MSNFIQRWLGTEPATATAIRARLGETRTALKQNVARVAAAEAALAGLAGMSADEHRLADAELGEARRERIRLDAQVAELETALAAAEQAEVDAALQAQADELRRRVEVDAAKALAAYEKAAAAVVQAIEVFAEIEVEVTAFNSALPRGSNLRVSNPEAHYRTTPGSSRPEVREKREVWEVWDHIHGAWVPAVMTVDAGGNRVPAQPGARRAFRDVVVQHARERGPVALPRLAEAVSLPPTRAGSPQVWPRKS